MPGYSLFDERWGLLFNSYYEAEGPYHPRGRRGLLSRPTLAEVLSYRRRIDDAILEAMPLIADRCPGLLELGLNRGSQGGVGKGVGAHRPPVRFDTCYRRL